MSRVILFAFIIAVAICGANCHYVVEADCVGIPNKSWDSCGTKCPLICGEEERFDCSRACFPSCQCHPGYYETPEGNCVLPENCPK